MNLRELVKHDWDDICAVYDAAAIVELENSGLERSAFTSMQEETSKDEFFNISSGLVACDSLQVVGFAAWRDRGTWRYSGYLSYLYIEPTYQKKGIGTQLLSQAMPNLGNQAWTLVKKGNLPAISLYKKFGMEIINRQNDKSEVRLAVPSSKKNDPTVPNFGTPYLGKA